MFFAKNKKVNLGELGEKIAVEYLKGKGYCILELNFYNKKGRRLGEIDIIARKDEKIFFVEVKTRYLSKMNNVLPEESINASKLKKLSKIASFYLRSNGLLDAQYQFDAISILVEKEKRNAKVRHLESIFF